MIVALIVAASENDVIGKDNRLPWHLPNDLKHFRTVTDGRPVIMGRKTFESIGKPLPGRRNIVLSTTVKHIQGAEVFPSLGDALSDPSFHAESGEVFVIGGVKVFQEALMEIMGEFRVQKIYLTRVHATIDGDVKLPPIHWNHWKRVSCEEHAADAAHQYGYAFETYERAA